MINHKKNKLELKEIKDISKNNLLAVLQKSDLF